MTTDLKPIRTDSSTYVRVSRAAGLLGLLFLVIGLPEGGTPFFSQPSQHELVSWVRHHPTALYVEGWFTVLEIVLVAAVIGTLLWRTGRRGLWTGIAALALAGNVAVDMVWGGSYFALAKLGEVGAGKDAIVAMFYVVQEFTFNDGFLFGIAMLVAGTLSVRTRTLPVPLGWFTVAVGAFHVVSVPLQIALTHTVEGLTGPASAVLFLVWLLAISLLLLIRPAWGPARRTNEG